MDGELQKDAVREEDLRRIQQAVAASGDIAYDWDLVEDMLTLAGDTAAFGLPFPPGEPVPAAMYLRCIDPEDILGRRRALHSHVTAGDAFDIEYPFVDGDRDLAALWINERGSAMLGPDGKPIRLVGTLRLVTEKKEQEARLLYESSHDVATGIFNRQKVTEVLDDLIRHNRVMDNRGLYLALAVDRFSIVNDAFGNDAGNAVLREIAARLDTVPPIGEILGRVGGDTFGIAVAHCDEEQIADLANSLLADINGEPVDTPSGPVRVTASIGCTTFPEAGEAAIEVMAKAELALRQAKNDGRNTFSRYEETRDHARAGRELLAIGDRVKRALAEDRLLLAYQPIVEAKTAEVSHYECLLRMIDEEGHIISAGAFMPAIEEMGLINEIDRLVVELAVRDLRQNPDIKLALNVSGLTTGNADWLARMKQIAEESPDLPPRMLLEITETAALRDVEETAAFVAALRELGATVALDDFGAGYTTFRNLRVLPIDVVKIDGSFIKKIAMERDNQIFVEALVTLARGFNLRTVAECVETEHDASILAAYGVDYLQGYYFGRPETDPPWAKTARPKRRIRTPSALLIRPSSDGKVRRPVVSAPQSDPED